MSKYKTGKELIQELEIRDFELLEYVKEGHQPLDQFGRSIPPPPVAIKIEELKRVESGAEWYSYTKDQDPNELIMLPTAPRSIGTPYSPPGKLPRGFVDPGFKRYHVAQKKIEQLKKDLDEIDDIYSWADYELPEEKKSAQWVIDLLLNACFKLDDVSMKASPLHATEPIDNTALTNNDDFISNLKVEYSSDNSIILTPKGKQPKEYSCQAMGFKATTQTWRMIIGILQKDDPKYHVGIYPKDKSRDKIKKYNSTIQIIKACEKKFVNFLNCEHSAQIPSNSRVFRNMKGIDRDGTYRPIFKVVRPSAEREEITKDMSKEQWQKGIDILVEKKRREKDPSKEDRLLSQMGPYIAKGNREGWLSKIQAEKYLSPNDEDCSPGDLLADAEPLPGNI